MGKEQITIDALIFDFDGTLVHLNIDFGAMRQGVEGLLVDYGIDVHDLKGFYILEMIDEAVRIISERNPSEGSRFYHESLELVTEHEVRAAREGKIIPGVTRMLERLGRQEVKVGIITRNCDKAVKILFPHIENLCDVFIPRDNVTGVKPHPDHLTLALKGLDVNDPERCFMVGDHILDIEAGKRMNMKTIGVLTGKIGREHLKEAGADYVFDDVTKIPGHFLGAEND